MADATKLPSLKYFQFGTPSSPTPSITAVLTDSVDSDTIKLSSPPLDENGAVITGDFILGVTNTDNYTEAIYCPAGSVSANGLTITGVIRGVRLTGLDYTTSNEDLVAIHQIGSPVFCQVNSIIRELVIQALKGNIATAGNKFVIGNDVDENITIAAKVGSGELGFIRRNSTSSKVEFSNDGAAWVSFDSAIAGTLVIVSGGDTTPSNLENKLVASDNITITKINSGGNEQLQIAANSQREGITEHEIYTPAYLTGGSNAETNIALWDSISNGSGRVTINGTTYNIDGMDFTASGPLGIVTDMDEVAAVIQYYVRQATSSTETVTWDTDHFVYTSIDTTSSSEFSVWTTSTGTVGTDISGAGASDWMDADTGNGTVTAPVLNAAADSGKVVLLTSEGNLAVQAVTGEASPTENDILAVDSNGNIKTSDQADYFNAYKLLHFSTPDTEVNGAVSNSNILSLSIPANIPADEAGFIRVTIDTVGEDAASTGQDGTVDLIVKANTTTITTGTIGRAGASNGPTFGIGKIDLSTKDGATNVRYSNFEYIHTDNSTTENVNPSGDTAFNTSSDWTLNLELTNNATSGHGVIVRKLIVEYIKVNT